MATNISIKINRTEGALEINADDKDWVDTKLKELEEVYKDPIQKVTSVVMPSSLPIVPSLDKSLSTPSQESTRKKKKAKSSGAAYKSQKNPNLEQKMVTDIKQKLKQFIAERKGSFDKSLSAQAVIIATFLQDELHWPAVSPDDLYTVYNVMGIPTPGNTGAQLNNARQRQRYFSGAENGAYKLSDKGESYARYEAKSEEITPKK